MGEAMPSISVSQHVWEQLQRESQQRGQSINNVLGELLGLPTTTPERTPQERTPIKTFREAIVGGPGSARWSSDEAASAHSLAVDDRAHTSGQ